MTDLRREIDSLDCIVVALLARRAAMIDRAAVLKPGEGLPARIDSRVEAVVANVRAEAVARHLDPNLVEALWRKLIDWSIDREETAMGPKGPKGDVRA
ncbi:MAG: chorismate mutase [Rhodobacteraceae bacterium]|nr:chorismate mutase [Paracoccaceae bacterium]